MVLLIQRGLKSVGLDPGSLDGLMGSRTRAAIENYQAQHNLTIDGLATEDLLRRLQGDSNVETSIAIDATPSRFAAFAESLPELGPVSVAMRMSLEDGAYRFDDLKIALGTAIVNLARKNVLADDVQFSVVAGFEGVARLRLTARIARCRALRVAIGTGIS